MLRIITLFMTLVHSALAATILSFDPQTQVLRLETQVWSVARPGGPDSYEVGQWSGTATLRITGIDQLFPPNTLVGLFVTIPALTLVETSHPNFAYGMACLNQDCNWRDPKTLSSSLFFDTEPGRSDRLVPVPDINMYTNSYAIWNNRTGASTNVLSAVRIDFGHLNLVAQTAEEVSDGVWQIKSRDITNIVPFSVASFDPQLPIPEPNSLWLAGPALVLIVVGSCWRSLYQPPPGS